MQDNILSDTTGAQNITLVQYSQVSLFTVFYLQDNILREATGAQYVPLIFYLQAVLPNRNLRNHKFLPEPEPGLYRTYFGSAGTRTGIIINYGSGTIIK